MLEDNAAAECRRYAPGIPEVVLASPDEYSPDESRIDHVRTCAVCRSRWTRFSQLATALGLLPLLSAALVIAPPPTSAQADDYDSVDPQPSRQPPRRLESAPPGVTAPTMGPAGVARIAIGLAAAVAGVLLVVVPAVEAMTSDAGSVGQSAGLNAEESGSADLSVSATHSADEVLLSIDFLVRDADWVVDELRLDLPEGVGVSAVPEGWVCTDAVGIIDCQTDRPSATGGVFRLTGREEAVGRYGLLLTARTLDATIVSASATGSIPAQVTRTGGGPAEVGGRQDGASP